MKKFKQLSSRHDVLDLWVSKWASIDSLEVKNIKHYWDAVDVVDLMVDLWAGYIEKARYNIYEILYSPESNFFEVMFQEKSKEFVFDAFTDLEFVKACCVNSSDPLQYLLDNLNETTSF